MAVNSTIEWNESTWHPFRGCTKVSPGYKQCYANILVVRFRGVPGHPFESGFHLRLVPAKLSDPFRWKNPWKIFMNSMSDLFQDSIPEDYIARVAEVRAHVVCE